MVNFLIGTWIVEYWVLFACVDVAIDFADNKAYEQAKAILLPKAKWKKKKN